MKRSPLVIFDHIYVQSLLTSFQVTEDKNLKISAVRGVAGFLQNDRNCRNLNFQNLPSADLDDIIEEAKQNEERLTSLCLIRLAFLNGKKCSKICPCQERIKFELPPTGIDIATGLLVLLSDWELRPGMKYGCDLMAYRTSPPECHSTYGISLIPNIDKRKGIDPFGLECSVRTTCGAAVERLLTNVGKSRLNVYVDIETIEHKFEEVGRCWARMYEAIVQGEMYAGQGLSGQDKRMVRTDIPKSVFEDYLRGTSCENPICLFATTVSHNLHIV